MDISEMRGLRGKKLLWIGTNAEVDHLYLVFEGMEALVLPHEPSYMGNATGLLKEVLAEHIDTAENVMALKQLMEGMKDERKSDPGASEKADPPAGS